MYRKNIKTSARQARLAKRIIVLKRLKMRAEAERARAESEYERAQLERKRAEWAEQRVEELTRQIAEQERLSKTLHESEEHFRHIALHDSLTGLPNRALLIDRLKRAIERAKRSKPYLFAVLFLDLDRFKNINDSLGHTYGDQLLITIAHRLQGCVRQTDTVARLGGDEFAILLDTIKDPNHATIVAEKIQQRLIAPLKLGKHEAFTTASIGVALSTTGYELPEEMLRDADTAMYRAKDNGKARHEVFDQAMHARAVSLLRLEIDLKRAIERGEFCNYYQPIISLKDGQLAGFETLIRWQHPERGLVSPAEFIPFAEDTGFIVPIGLSVLEEACRQMREWQRLLPASQGLTMSVNLSGKQLSHPDLVEEVKQILQKTELDPWCLKLEITESAVMENAEEATIILEKLRALGVGLSIDDFGTGYSSLSYLYRFPVDTLKVDRSFISRLGLNKENFEIVRTIVTLAHNLKMEVVAEGIEESNQHALLRTLKCEYGQGYLFSRPLNRKEAEALLQDKLQELTSMTPPTHLNQKENAGQLDSALVM